MSDIERPRGLLKLGGGEQAVEDLRHLFVSVDHAAALGHDPRVDQLWLSTPKPLRIDFGSDPNDFMMAEVLDGTSAPAIAEMEIDEMLGPNPTPSQTAMRDSLGLEPGMALGDNEKDMLRDVFGEILRRMGGVAIVSCQTVEGLAITRGFYEDMRGLGR